MIVKRLFGTTALAIPLVLAAADVGAADLLQPAADEEGQQIAQQQQGQPTQGGQSTPLEEETDMPATQHQEETLRPAGGEEQRRTAPPEGADMPSSEHQRELLKNGEQGQKNSQ
jgi:hypothetical protein